MASSDVFPAAAGSFLHRLGFLSTTLAESKVLNLAALFAGAQAL